MCRVFLALNYRLSGYANSLAAGSFFDFVHGSCLTFISTYGTIIIDVFSFYFKRVLICGKEIVFLKIKLSRVIFISVLIALAVFLTACGGGTTTTNPPDSHQNPERPDREPQLLETGSGITVIRAADWEAEHPDIYASYLKNNDNSEHYQYPDAYPYIKVLYEGMGFAFDYNSPRGHTYSLTDIDATGRPHPFSNCFTCKTPDLHALIAEDGTEVYAIPYEDLKDQMIEPVSCFNCHANDPSGLTVTHQYLSHGLGSDFSDVAPESLACAQCHVEYHFDPITREVILPYNNLESMNPDSILNYYNNLLLSDGQAFADYVNPRSGVRQIKVQHPEFETFYGSGSVHKGSFTCADCHMGYVDNSNGERFVSHEWISPLAHPNLVAENCSKCHTGNMAEYVQGIQSEANERTNAVGILLEELTEALVLAVDSGEYSDEELEPVRTKFRDAQFYWDFVFVENSDGAHNSSLTHQLLEKAEMLYDEAKALLDALVN